MTGLLITLGGMIVMHTGHHLKSRNHSDSINYFLYPIARGFDIILTMFMLSLAIIMTAVVLQPFIKVSTYRIG